MADRVLVKDCIVGKTALEKSSDQLMRSSGEISDRVMSLNYDHTSAQVFPSRNDLFLQLFFMNFLP